MKMEKHHKNPSKNCNLLASCEDFRSPEKRRRSLHSAKRMECAQLAAAHDRQWIASRLAALDRPRTFDSGSKLHVLQTLRAVQLRLRRAVSLRVSAAFQVPPKFLAFALAVGFLVPFTGAVTAAPIKVHLATLAPKGSSYTKHLQVMGEAWRKAPAGGALLTIYPDGTMGSEADMVRRMRLGQLQAAMVTTSGLLEIEPGVAGLQSMPKVFRTLEEVDFIDAKMEPMLEKRLEEKGFIVLFWSDTGFVRFFSKQPVVAPDDLRKTKLFVAANRPAEMDIYRYVGCNPVPLEVADILPSLQTGLIDCVCMPPSIALAIQLDSIAPHMLDMNCVPL